MSPFNLRNYEILLAKALSAGYRYIGFHQIKEPGIVDVGVIPTSDVQSKGRILLRHDVDADLAAAVVMARVEAQLGIQSTYFLMWRSPCYNLMSRAGQNCAEEILGLGHHIGLHYDQGFDALRGLAPQLTAEQVSKQADWLESLLSCQVSAVSFHQPSESLLQAGMNCGARINTYDRTQLVEYRYVSDSNRVFPLWRPAEENSALQVDLYALAKSYPQNLQLLVHPMWWVYDAEITELVWERALLSNFEQMQEQLCETERAYGKKRTLSILKP